MLLDDSDLVFINEEFHAEKVDAAELDQLLDQGWRHFGTQFYRYSLAVYEVDIRRVIPLRIRLANFSTSKSLRRVLRQNADLEIVIGPVEITQECEDLFERHKQRFKFGVPDSIYDFLSDDPSRIPCETFQLTVRVDNQLAAASYFDIGDRAVSAIYAMFDLELSHRSLGIFTMLKEIEFAIAQNKELYYQGYSYEGRSFYDYKKRFRGTENYDWKGSWSAFTTAEE